ncbi:MAG: hypothetical protein ACRBI6_01840 [Acidimicrobiales bacterium]
MAEPTTRSLEEERDFLLRSIEDLDAELAAGDLSADDHERLRDDYVARAAATLRALAARTAEDEAANEAANEAADAAADGTAGEPADEGAAGGPSRRFVWAGGLAVFAVVAGLLLANFAGERGASDALTGSIEPSLRQKNTDCQRLGAEGEMEASLSCFDEILAEDPQNVDALTYRGWYLFLTAQSAAASGVDDLALELLGRAESNLAQAVEIDPEAVEARAFRAVVFNRMGDSDASCAELAVLDTLDPPPMITDLTAALAADC